MIESSEIVVKIKNKSECIYENILKNEGKGLSSLISNLKSMQENINGVLTKLVEGEKQLNIDDNVADEKSDEEEDDSNEDDNLNSKKCKYK